MDHCTGMDQLETDQPIELEGYYSSDVNYDSFMTHSLNYILSTVSEKGNNETRRFFIQAKQVREYVCYSMYQLEYIKGGG